jgi:hypothetical protein
LEALRGISPDIQKYIEDDLIKTSLFDIERFPYKKLGNKPIHNIFDKKWCTELLKYEKKDIYVMTKLDFKKDVGNMNKDEWDLQIRLYNTNTGKQMYSKIKAVSMKGEDFPLFIQKNINTLINEINNL